MERTIRIMDGGVLEAEIRVTDNSVGVDWHEPNLLQEDGAWVTQIVYKALRDHILKKPDAPSPPQSPS